MSTYGFNRIENIGKGIQVTADGAPIAKAGGVTIDWGSVVAAAADTTYQDNDVVYTGEKFLRYGQVVCKILTSTGGTDAANSASKIGKYAPFGVTTSVNTGGGTDTLTLSIAKGDCYVINESIHENMDNSDFPPAIDGGRVWKKRLLVGGTATNEVQTATVTGGPITAGTFTLTLPASLGGATTTPIAYNATNVVVQAALTAALAPFNTAVNNNQYNTGQPPVVITVGGTPLATGPITFTFSGGGAALDVDPIAVNGAGLTPPNTLVMSTTTPGVVGGPTFGQFETAFPMITYVPE